MSTNSSRYGMVSSIYDRLGDFWTRGKIRESKLWHLQFLSSEDRVLFVGSGTSEDAILASKIGAEVVVIEISDKMLSQTRNRLLAEGITEIELIKDDILNHSKLSDYDVIVANYFLDVFNFPTMQAIMLHFTRLLKRNGLLYIAGFKPPSGGILKRVLAEIHHGIPIFIFHLFLGNALHKIYDYRATLNSLNFTIEKRVDLPIFKKCDFGVHAICARYMG